MKRLLFILIIAILSTQAQAKLTDTLSVGVAGGLSSYHTFRGEIYAKSSIKLLNRNTEIKVGLNNRSYNISFDNINDLEVSSLGVFGDIAIYPFNKGLFVGIRWELININLLSSSAQQKVSTQRDYFITSYSGTCAFIQLGYKIELNKNIALKIFAQPGIQQYKIYVPEKSTTNNSGNTTNPKIESIFYIG